jgi:hypothetical protein
MKIIAVIEKTKMITIKIIENESKNDSVLFQLQRSPYLAHNLSSAVTDSRILIYL